MNKKGFTLIELLVAISIIGLLVAIAIPEYKSYRARSYNAVAANDFHNIATAQEAYWVDNETFYNDISGINPDMLPGFVPSDGVEWGTLVRNRSFNSIGYWVKTEHINGSLAYCYDNDGEEGAPVVGTRPADLGFLVNDCW